MGRLSPRLRLDTPLFLVFFMHKVQLSSPWTIVQNSPSQSLSLALSRFWSLKSLPAGHCTNLNSSGNSLGRAWVTSLTSYQEPLICLCLYCRSYRRGGSLWELSVLKASFRPRKIVLHLWASSLGQNYVLSMQALTFPNLGLFSSWCSSCPKELAAK